MHVNKALLGPLFGAITGLIGFSARAEMPAFLGNVSLGGESVRGVVGPEGQSQLSGLLLGAAFGIRFRGVVAGTSAEVVGELLGGHNENFVAVHAGWSGEGAMGRLTAAGEFGRHSYSDLGSGFLTGNRATSASLPFVGLRVVATMPATSVFGWSAVRRDLGTAVAADAGPLWGEGGNWQLGGTAICVGLGVGFDTSVNRPRSNAPSSQAPTSAPSGSWEGYRTNY